MDKDSREALQVAKELTAKFIETRTVSPGNFAEIFPAVYNVVASTIARSDTPDPDADAGDAVLKAPHARKGHGDRERA